MKSKKYKDIVINHMTSYKNTFLGINSKGVYRNSPINYGHILPDANSTNAIPIYNFLPTIDTTSYKLQSTQMKYHQYAHHLNSSQLMCINFFFPIIDNSILLNILKKQLILILVLMLKL